MKLRELLEEYVIDIVYAGQCECGEIKYDLITNDNLIYPPVHENTIKLVRPDLMPEFEVVEVEG